MFAISDADDPSNDPNISGDPYKTLFVAKLVCHFRILCMISHFSSVSLFLFASSDISKC